MIKRSFLFILTFTLLTNLTYCGYFDSLKRLVPSWHYSVAWFVSGLCLFKGLKNINYNWTYNSIPKQGPIEDFDYNQEKDNVVVTQNGKDFDIPYWNRELRFVKYDLVRKNSQEIYCKKLLGPDIKLSMKINSTSNGCKDLSYDNKFVPNKESFKSGWMWTGMSAAYLLYTAACVVHQKNRF